MARFVEFNNPITRIQPDQAGSEAREIEGRHLGASFNELGREVGGSIESVATAWEAGRTENEIGQFNTAKVGFLNDMDASLRDYFSKTSPFDPDNATKYLEGVEPQFNKLLDMGQEFTPAARKQVEEFVNQQRLSFTRQAHVEQAQAATSGSIQGFLDVGQNFQQRVAKSPWLLSDTLDAYQTTAEGLKENPNLTPEGRAQIDAHSREQSAKITLSAMHSMATTNAPQFRSDLAAGKFDKFGIVDEDKQQLDEFAKRQEGLQRQDQQLAIRQASEKARRGYEAELADPNVDPMDIQRRALRDTALEGGDPDSVFRLAQTVMNERIAASKREDTVTERNNPLLNAFMNEINSGQFKTGSADSAVGNGLTMGERNFLETMAAGRKTKEGAAINQVINTWRADAHRIIAAAQGGVSTPEAANAIAAFDTAFIREMEQRRQHPALIQKNPGDTFQNVLGAQDNVEKLVKLFAGQSETGQPTSNAAQDMRAAILRQSVQKPAAGGTIDRAAMDKVLGH